MARITLAICSVSTCVWLSSVVLAQDLPPTSRCSIGVGGLPELTSHHCRTLPFQITPSKCGVVVVDGRVSHFGIVGPDNRFHRVQSIRDFGNYNGRLIDFCLSDEEGTMAAINVGKAGRAHAMVVKEGQVEKEHTFGNLRLPIAWSVTTLGKRSVGWVNDSSRRLCVVELSNGVPVFNSSGLQLGNTVALSSFGHSAAVLQEKDSPSAFDLSFFHWSREGIEKTGALGVSVRGLDAKIALVSEDRLLVCESNRDKRISFKTLPHINQNLAASVIGDRGRPVVLSSSASGESVALVVRLNGEHYRLHIFRLSGVKLDELSRLSFAAAGLDSYEDFLVSWIGESPVVGWRCFAPTD